MGPLSQTILTDSTGSYAVLILASGPRPDLAAFHAMVSETGIWPRRSAGQLLLPIEHAPATNMEWLPCGKDMLLQVWARTELTFHTYIDEDSDLDWDIADLTIELAEAWPTLTFRIVLADGTNPDAPFELQSAGPLGRTFLDLSSALPILVVIGDGDHEDERIRPRGVLMPVSSRFRYRYTDAPDLASNRSAAALARVLLRWSGRELVAISVNDQRLPQEKYLEALQAGFGVDADSEWALFSPNAWFIDDSDKAEVFASDDE